VLPHDELAAQIAEPDSLLAHYSTPLSRPLALGSTLPETCSFVKRVFHVKPLYEITLDSAASHAGGRQAQAVPLSSGRPPAAIPAAP
ncbi:MAG TPA: hypothetical protein VFE59_33935, partial [Trebonia sp.]|nr:hypothetical protein [Trebonia sp.]